MTSDIQHISAPDGKNIYYYMNTAQPAQSAQLIIIGHGLTGHPNEYIHQTAWRHMTQNGFDVCRIAFYDSAENARHLNNCTIQIHADDLNALISHLRAQAEYKNIFYCGHSYGGITGLLANPDVTATAFWDSTYVPDFWPNESAYIEALDCYKLNWEVEALVSKAMVTEAAALTHEKMQIFAQNYTSPALVVLAGANQDILEKREQLFNDLSVTKERLVINGADHCFYNGNTAQELATQTTHWFKKHI